MPEPLCPCGRPLHYQREDVRRAVELLVAELGEMQPVTVAGSGTWEVPRHFIALHGFRGADLPMLAAFFGWAKVG